MDKLKSQQSNLKLLLTENLLNLFDLTTKQARTDSAWETESGEVCWKYFCILLWFLFYEYKMDQN